MIRVYRLRHPLGWMQWCSLAAAVAATVLAQWCEVSDMLAAAY